MASGVHQPMAWTGVDRDTELRTARLWLRGFRHDDVDDALAYRDDREFARYLPHIPQPFTRADADAFVARNIDEPWATLPTFAVVLADHVVGTVNLEIDPVHGVAMLGYGLARAHWGRGLATEAAAAVVAWTFATHELIAIWASTHADNLRSQRVLAKLGMTPDPATGTERRYWLRRPAASRAAR